MSLGLLDGLCPATPQGAWGAAGCFAASWDAPILGLLLIVIAWAAFAFLRRARGSVSIPLVLPMRGPRRIKGDALGPRFSEAEYERQREAMRRALAPLGPVPATGGAPGRPSALPDLSRRENGELPAATSAGQPPEGTLQLLPGRLEIERGPGRGEEVRFVRTPGAKQEITLGRKEGPPHQHVKLDSPTVSREHARLAFRDGVWVLRNESSTNPTVHNGRALSSAVEEVPLEDGDKIEIGDVLLVFHQDAPADRLPFRSSWYTDRGRRAVNQDAVVVRTLPGGRELAAVCDGMGSHAEGGLASHVALEGLVVALSKGKALKEAVEDANAAVLEAAANSPDRSGMGTTLVAVLRDGERYEVVNVGDSRAYRVDGSGIEQITQDHSFVAEAVQSGRMSREEAASSPWKNAVTRSLGTDAAVDVDRFGAFEAGEPTMVILCTDGVHGVLGSSDILDIIGRTANIRDVARELGEQALINGGEDNVAVAAVQFGTPNGAKRPS